MQTREKWLLTILSGIFVIQAAVFVYGLRVCTDVAKPKTFADVCPQIGRRFDTTFGGMVATTLALLTGATVIGDKKPTTKPTPPPPGRQ